jgi:hypothetical protein
LCLGSESTAGFAIVKYLTLKMSFEAFSKINDFNIYTKDAERPTIAFPRRAWERVA